jgi:hypothetical protein
MLTSAMRVFTNRKAREIPPRPFPSQWAGGTQKAPNPDCPIKGNINRDGERIYHTPWGSHSYDRTKINTAKGERWFCDEAEAAAAGWRAPFQ